jgi:hypothetical protein
MPLSTVNTRIRQVYRELGNIVNNGGLAARLPQSLLDRLKAMRGILLEELNSPPETDSDGDFLSAELSQDARPQSSAARFPVESPQLSGVHS